MTHLSISSLIKALDKLVDEGILVYCSEYDNKFYAYNFAFKTDTIGLFRRRFDGMIQAVKEGHCEDNIDFVTLFSYDADDWEMNGSNFNNDSEANMKNYKTIKSVVKYITKVFVTANSAYAAYQQQKLVEEIEKL